MNKEFVQQKRQQLNISEQGVMRLINLAIKETDEQLPLLERAIENVDYVQTQLISHRIKGYLLNLRFDHLGNIAQQINLMSISKVEIQSIKIMLEQFKSDFESLRKDINN